MWNVVCIFVQSSSHQFRLEFVGNVKLIKRARLNGCPGPRPGESSYLTTSTMYFGWHRIWLGTPTRVKYICRGNVMVIKTQNSADCSVHGAKTVLKYFARRRLLKQHWTPHDLFNGDGNGPFLTLVLCHGLNWTSSHVAVNGCASRKVENIFSLYFILFGL